jgi:predicted nucleic-acid-binding Zn-ribbon protein
VDLEYGSMDLGSSGDTIFYPVTCKKCGFTGKEWYDLNFSGFTDDDGNEVE